MSETSSQIQVIVTPNKKQHELEKKLNI